MGDRYRVRWANASTDGGHMPAWRTQRMCIAERRNWLGWWPVIDAQYRYEEAQALSDIEADKELRKPFPPTRYVP